MVLRKCDFSNCHVELMPTTLINAPEIDTLNASDVLFSRTDDRGVIVSANDVFKRISGFEWAELIGAPHKIVRHPNMPRAVFQLIWDTIQSGNPVGAYVTNRTKTEGSYTLFAVIMPFENGFVSVRLMPTSPQVNDIKKAYDRIREREVSENLNPKESVAALEHEICALGFVDYAAFMADALERETLAHGQILKRPRLRRLEALSNIQSAVETIEAEGKKIETLIRATNQIPYNMRLQAMRLEGRDGPIGVISANHQTMSDNFATSLRDFVKAATTGVAPVRDAKFLTATTSLIAEAADSLRHDTGMRSEKKATDLLSLSRLADYYMDKSLLAVKDVSNRAAYFDRVCKDMRRMVFGLEMTRTMCKIERSKTTGDTEGLDEIIDRLHNVERQLSEMMARIENAVRGITDSVEGLQSAEKLPSVGQASDAA